MVTVHGLCVVWRLCDLVAYPHNSAHLLFIHVSCTVIIVEVGDLTMTMRAHRSLLN